MNHNIGRAWPRAGLGGNPSDGYGGRTVAFTFDAFEARARVVPMSAIRVGDLEAANLADARDRWPLEQYGHSSPLLAATVTVFARELERLGLGNAVGGFELEWETTIPRSVGLGGSSAMAVAALRGLATWAGIALAPLRLAHLALTVETDELGIAAGPQDRVVQALEGLVHMDFGGERAGAVGEGEHIVLSPDLLPTAFVAWRPALSEDSGVYHADLRRRYDAGDRAVHEAMRRWAEIASEMRGALEVGDSGRACDLVDENFDLRRTVSRVTSGDSAMVEAARMAGAAAKQAGSGGAVVGLLRPGRRLADVAAALRNTGAEFREVRPVGGSRSSAPVRDGREPD